MTPEQAHEITQWIVAEGLEDDQQRSLCVKLLANQAKLHRDRAEWCRRFGRESGQDETRRRMAAQADEALTHLEAAERLMRAAMLNAKDMQLQRGS